MSNRKRFIAGAVCPVCQAQDTLAMWREDNVDVVQCVQCGHLERRADAHAEQHVRKDEQVIGIFTRGITGRCFSQRIWGICPKTDTVAVNSVTIGALIKILSPRMCRRYHESSKRPVVSPAYQVRTEDGVLVDESPASAPLDYLHGRGALISGLESALDGRVAGDVFDVDVGANDAYGQYDENLVQRVPKDVFVGVDELEVGMRFRRHRYGPCAG